MRSCKIFPGTYTSSRLGDKQSFNWCPHWPCRPSSNLSFLNIVFFFWIPRPDPPVLSPNICKYFPPPHRLSEDWRLTFSLSIIARSLLQNSPSLRRNIYYLRAEIASGFERTKHEDMRIGRCAFTTGVFCLFVCQLFVQADSERSNLFPDVFSIVFLFFFSFPL